MLEEGRAREGWRMVVNPILCFLKGYLLKRGFLDGLPGLAHVLIHCFFTFIKYAKLRQARQDDPGKGQSR